MLTGRPRGGLARSTINLLLARVLLRPPCPPAATSRRSPSRVRSPSNSPVSASKTRVPNGTTTSSDSPPRPVQSAPEPPSPLFTAKRRFTRKSTSVLSALLATSQTPPPSPPSPPSGPPRGMNFSRRKLTQPGPPLPATTRMVASSTNFMVAGAGDRHPDPETKNPADAGFF